MPKWNQSRNIVGIRRDSFSMRIHVRNLLFFEAGGRDLMLIKQTFVCESIQFSFSLFARWKTLFERNQFQFPPGIESNWTLYIVHCGKGYRCLLIWFVYTLNWSMKLLQYMNWSYQRLSKWLDIPWLELFNFIKNKNRARLIAHLWELMYAIYINF